MCFCVYNRNLLPFKNDEIERTWNRVHPGPRGLVSRAPADHLRQKRKRKWRRRRRREEDGDGEEWRSETGGAPVALQE